MVAALLIGQVVVRVARVAPLGRTALFGLALLLFFGVIIADIGTAGYTGHICVSFRQPTFPMRHILSFKRYR